MRKVMRDKQVIDRTYVITEVYNRISEKMNINKIMVLKAQILYKLCRI